MKARTCAAVSGQTRPPFRRRLISSELLIAFLPKYVSPMPVRAMYVSISRRRSG